MTKPGIGHVLEEGHDKRTCPHCSGTAEEYKALMLSLRFLMANPTAATLATAQKDVDALIRAAKDEEAVDSLGDQQAMPDEGTVATAHAAIDEIAAALTPAPSENREERAEQLRRTYEVAMRAAYKDPDSDWEGWLAVADAAQPGGDRLATIEAAWIEIRDRIPQYKDAPLTPEGLKHGIRQLAALYSGEKYLRKRGIERGVDAGKVRGALELFKDFSRAAPLGGEKMMQAKALLESALAKETN